jgi:hypothetical protein
LPKYLGQDFFALKSQGGSFPAENGQCLTGYRSTSLQTVGLSKKNRDLLAKEMTPEAVSQAQELASKWMESH